MATTFIKATTGGLIVTDKAMSVVKVKIAGVEKEVRTQGGIIGFIAVSDAKALPLKAGDIVKFSITEKPVIDLKTKRPIPNLFWADPDL